MPKLTKAQRAEVSRLRARARQEEEMGLLHAREAQRLERMANRIEADPSLSRSALAQASEGGAS